MDAAGVDALARDCSAAGDRLAEALRGVRERQADAARDAEAELRSLAADYEASREALRAAVAGHPELFAKPRSRTVEGVKFGRRKAPDRARFRGGMEAAVARIREKLPDLADALVTVKESVSLAALRSLSKGQLRAAGAAIEEGRDEATVERVRDGLDAAWAAALAGLDAGR